MGKCNLPKNRDYKQSIYWTKTIMQEPEPPTFIEKLKSEDRTFDKQWKAYWRQRSKWASFEDYLKSAA